MEFRQLLPEAATVEIEPLLASLTGGLEAREDRPYTMVNFISSVDGRATIKGRSGGLGDDGDRAMFHGLREQVDAVLAGTGTLRTERYGRVLGKAERRERRVARGLTPEPLACIISRSGELPTNIPLFSEPEARVVVFAPTHPDTSGATAQVEVVVLEREELTPTAVLRLLRAHHGVETLLCEGGPTLFGALLHERVADELFLTLAPKLAGGGAGVPITSGPELDEPQPMHIRWLLERNGSLYLRYSLHQVFTSDL
jgi:5-amino-6-(5-phosphoribosylamino)uracil reductase